MDNADTLTPYEAEERRKEDEALQARSEQAIAALLQAMREAGLSHLLADGDIERVARPLALQAVKGELPDDPAACVRLGMQAMLERNKQRQREARVQNLVYNGLRQCVLNGTCASREGMVSVAKKLKQNAEWAEEVMDGLFPEAEPLIQAPADGIGAPNDDTLPAE